MGATGWPDARRPQQSGGLCKLSWSIRSPPDPEVQISPPPGTRVGTPSVRRLRLEHDDLGFLEEAARRLRVSGAEVFGLAQTSFSDADPLRSVQGDGRPAPGEYIAPPTQMAL